MQQFKFNENPKFKQNKRNAWVVTEVCACYEEAIITMIV